MECEFQDGGHRLWEGTATLETLDRGSIGVVPLDGQRGIFQQTESANVQMVCAVVFVEKSGLQNVKVLDKLAGKKLLALAPGHLFTEGAKEGKGLPQVLMASQASTPWSQFHFWSRACGSCAHCPYLPLSLTGHIRAAGPGVGVCAHLHLLGGESAPGASGWSYLVLGLGPSWWWAGLPGFIHKSVYSQSLICY